MCYTSYYILRILLFKSILGNYNRPILFINFDFEVILLAVNLKLTENIL